MGLTAHEVSEGDVAIALAQSLWLHSAAAWMMRLLDRSGLK